MFWEKEMWSEHHWNNANWWEGWWTMHPEWTSEETAADLVQGWKKDLTNCPCGDTPYPETIELIRVFAKLLESKRKNKKVIIVPDGENPELGRLCSLRDKMCAACVAGRK